MSAGRAPGWAGALYRLVLRLHPREQRLRYGAEMTRVFDRVCRRAAAEGRLGRTVAGELGALALTGLRSRLRGTGLPGGIDPVLALRSVVRNPVPSAGVVATLAVGLGTFLAAFVFVDAVILREAADSDRGELVEVWTWSDGRNDASPTLSLEAVEALREADDLFEAVEVGHVSPAVVSMGVAPEYVTAARVSDGLLALLGLVPERGSGLAGAGDGVPPALVKEGLARRLLGEGDPLGRTLSVDGRDHVVAGVMFGGWMRGFGEAEVWTPFPEYEDGRVAAGQALARLRPGLDPATADAALATRADAWAGSGILAPGTRPTLLEPVVYGVPDSTRRALWILFGAVCLILLTATTNVLALALARALDRRGEAGIRLALGEGRRSITLRSVAEGLVLGIVGGAAAGMMAAEMLAWLVPRVPMALRLGSVGRTLSVEPTDVVLGLGLGAAIGALGGVVQGRVATAGIMGVPEGGRTTTQRVGAARARMGLVAAQTALAFVLLSGTGLLGSTLIRLLSVEPGYDAERLLVGTLLPPPERYASAEDRARLFDRAEEALAELPGVESVTSTAARFPLPNGRFGVTMELDDGSVVPFDGILPFLPVDEAFFAVAGVALVEGRPFASADDPVGTVILGRSLARRLAPDGGAVGRRLRIDDDGPWRTVVGVAEDVVQIGPRDPSGGDEYYVPLGSDERLRERTFLVRTSGSPTALVGRARRRLAELDPELPFLRLAPLADEFTASTARERFYLGVMGVLAGAGVLLTLVGLQGLLAHQVRARTREMGVRTAFGAHPARLLGGVVRQGVQVALVGVLAGGAATLWLSGFLESLLFGVEANDPATLAVAAILFLLAAAGASAIPGARALRMDPVRALSAD